MSPCSCVGTLALVMTLPEHARFVLVRLVLLTVLGCLVTLAIAHPTAAYGDFRIDPPAPGPGEPFIMEVVLAGPGNVPIEDAVVLAELRQDPEDDPITARFEEGDTPGRYLAQARVPRAGEWQVLLRDQTFRQEEAQAELSVEIGGAPTGWMTFVLPPTATGGSNLRTWLWWVVGLPVVAGAVLTVSVLTRPEEEEET